MWWVAVAAAGWVEVGPERGHVIDVGVAGDEVLVTTRAGVRRAELGLEAWERDGRFPETTQRIEPGDGGWWAASGDAVWWVGDELEAVAGFGLGSAIVDLAAGDGVAWVAVRGEAAGVYRVSSGGVEVVLDDVDPWQLAVRGGEVSVATLEAGVVTVGGARGTGAVCGVGWVGAALWHGTDSGAVYRDGEQVGQLDEGCAFAFAGLGDEVRFLVDGEYGPGPVLGTWDGSVLGRIGLPELDDDPFPIHPTGLWSVGDGLLLGTFRRGPARVDGAGVAAARSGFRATLTGDAAVAGGRWVAGLMSTGTYVEVDGAWQPVGGERPPATDVPSVSGWGEDLVVVDFEGLTVVDGALHTDRVEGVAGQGRGNGLVDVAEGPEGRLWGIDASGKLWRRDGTWAACGVDGVERLDGAGEHLVLATSRGYLRAACGEGEQLWADYQGSVASSRSDGGWLAGPGGLWRGEERIGELPKRRVTALAAEGDEALVGLEDGSVLRCSGACESLSRLPEAPLKLGWLPDGRAWVAERKGTLLAEGDGELGRAFLSSTTVLPMGPRSREAPPVDSSLSRGVHVLSPTNVAALDIPPWRRLGRPEVSAELAGPAGVEVAPTTEVPAAAAPWWRDPAKLALAVVYALVAVGVGGLLRRRPKRRRRRR